MLNVTFLLPIVSENSLFNSCWQYDVMPYFCCLLTELPEKPILLPPFVDSAHRLSYHLSRKGRSVTDRVVCVLGFACPDITYSPAVYPIAALLLHFMSGKNPLRYTICFFLFLSRNLSNLLVACLIWLAEITLLKGFSVIPKRVSFLKSLNFFYHSNVKGPQDCIHKLGL